METPERNQIESSKSKYEDSPVFNYLSNLSPIKPVKSATITHTFTSLNFDSLSPVFTSPHAISHKESRLLRRHNIPEKSYPDISYTETGNNKENEVFFDVNQLYNNSKEIYKQSGELNSFGRAPLKPRSNESDFSMEFHQLEYSCDTSKSDSSTRMSIGKDASHSDEAATSPTMFDMIFASGGEDLLSMDFDSPGMATDLDALLKSPPGECTGPRALPFPQDTTEFLKFDPAFSVDDVCEPQNENRINSSHGHSTTMTESMTGHPVANDEPTASLHCGGRRCFVFDRKAQRKIMLGGSVSNPSTCTLLDQKISSKNRKRSPNDTSSLCVFPGIGLHLNALAVSRDRDYGVQNIVSDFVSPFQSPTTAQEYLHGGPKGESTVNNVNSDQGSEDASQELDLVSPGDENSPMKKRHKQGSSEDESCKHCNCKKSKCLKLYCECFAAGVYCIGTCACQGCLNKATHKDIVLETRKQIESRNPLAFAPKVIMTSYRLPDVKEQVLSTPASARHKKGCNCKKSGCSKKYCECYQGGVGCSINCRCESCKNIYGTKDGKGPAPLAQQEEDEYEVETEKIRKKMNNKFPNKGEHFTNSFPQTPRLTRMSVQLPFSSKDKPPRYSFLSGDSTSRRHFYKPNHFNRAGDDDTEMPDIQQSNGSPGSNVNISSPNSKRISSLNSNLNSPTARSTRKLILKSIPSFPSLSQQ